MQAVGREPYLTNLFRAETFSVALHCQSMHYLTHARLPPSKQGRCVQCRTPKYLHRLTKTLLLLPLTGVPSPCWTPLHTGGGCQQKLEPATGAAWDVGALSPAGTSGGREPSAAPVATCMAREFPAFGRGYDKTASERGVDEFVMSLCPQHQMSPLKTCIMAKPFMAK